MYNAEMKVKQYLFIDYNYKLEYPKICGNRQSNTHNVHLVVALFLLLMWYQFWCHMSVKEFLRGNKVSQRIKKSIR